MKPYYIPATNSTPEINFSFATGKLYISGHSTDQNPDAIYQYALQWLDEYALEPRPYTQLHINLEYYNTIASEYLYGILKKIKQLKENGNQVTITWQYQPDDEYIKQEGQFYSEILQLPVEFMEIN